jgi:FkbM family methyltransferase
MVDVRELSYRFPKEQKSYLEGLLSRYPSDRLLLDAYYESLESMSQLYIGIINVMIPETKFPLFFRANSSDLWNLRQIFQLREYDFDFPNPPRRILDLGAYVGFAAVYFANRFPSAKIICVEPDKANFELLRMNTVAYPKIKLIHGAIWHHSAWVNLKEKMGGEDWAGVFEEKEEGRGCVQAYSVGELLRTNGWTNVDYVKCDIEGAEVEVFSDPRCAEWVSGTTCVSVEMHDRFRPGCTETVQAALSAEVFDRRQSGEYSLFIRRQSRIREVNDHGVEPELVQLAPDSLSKPMLVRPLLLDQSAVGRDGTAQLHGAPRFRLMNVSSELWGFIIIDENTFQLHPNNPGEPLAEMELTINLSGQNQFSTRILVEGFGTQDVVFSVTLGKHDSIILHEERQVGPGEMIDWLFSTVPCFGPHRITFATRMAPGAQNHGGAWARWMAPTLCVATTSSGIK